MKQTEKSSKTLIMLLVALAIPILLVGIAAIVIFGMVAKGGMAAATATMILVIIMVVVIALIGFGTRTALVRFAKVVGSVDKIADGSLDLEDNKLSERDDELGRMMRSLSDMVKSFAKVVAGI